MFRCHKDEWLVVQVKHHSAWGRTCHVQHTENRQDVLLKTDVVDWGVYCDKPCTCGQVVFGSIGPNLTRLATSYENGAFILSYSSQYDCNARITNTSLLISSKYKVFLPYLFLSLLSLCQCPILSVTSLQK